GASLVVAGSSTVSSAGSSTAATSSASPVSSKSDSSSALSTSAATSAGSCGSSAMSSLASSTAALISSTSVSMFGSSSFSDTRYPAFSTVNHGYLLTSSQREGARDACEVFRVRQNYRIPRLHPYRTASRAGSPAQ